MRKKTKRKLKKFGSTLLIVSLATVMSWLGIVMIIDNRDRNLGEVKQIDGVVESTKVIERTTRVGAFPSSTSKKTDLYTVKLINLDIKLGTYNPSENYQNIHTSLGEGDSIKIYYYPTSEYQNNIYQLEKDGSILVSHSDYKENHTVAGIAILSFGLFMFIFGFWFIKRSR